MSAELLETTMLIIFLVVVGVVLWRQYQAGKPINIADVIVAVQTAQPIIERVRTVAEAAVLAQEQIKRDGSISNEQAFQKAFAELRKQFPITSGVTDAEIIREINRAVLIASTMSAQIKGAKDKVTTSTPPEPPRAKPDNSGSITWEVGQ